MEIELNNGEIEVSEQKTVEELIETVKEKLSSTRSRLVGIKVDGKFLTQSELEGQYELTLEGKDIELVTETIDELTAELIEDALIYLDGLTEWVEGFSVSSQGDILSEIDTNEIEELLDGLHWLNLALEELAGTSETGTLLGGRSLPKFMSENRMFLNEIQGALENPEENPQLIRTLIVQDLPTWIEEYRDVFLDFRGERRREIDV
jgi:sulfur carrier protein ThiS